MTWANRLRLYGSILATLLVAAALVLLFNQRQHQISSVSASIDAPQYTIGSDYSGIVESAHVKAGDRVTVGEPILTMASIGLRQDLANNVKVTSNDAMDVDPVNGTITYKAVTAGVVTSFDAEKGTYLAPGQAGAVITEDGGRSVLADYVLQPRDYVRIQQGSRVDLLLPNNKEVQGAVESASVQTEDGRALTRLRITSDALNGQDMQLLSTRGAPVVATVFLRDEGILAGPTDATMDFLRKIGLR